MVEEVEYELGNWPNELTWHIIYKTVALPICNTENVSIDIIPMRQPFTVLRKMPICSSCLQVLLMVSTKE